MKTTVIVTWCLLLAVGYSKAAPNINCSTVLCKQVVCKEGETPVTPSGACCPVCQPERRPYGIKDCSVVRCALPKCLPGSELYTPPGKCCPKCRPGCLHDGQFYGNGESFKIDCNTCRCIGENVACTRKACPPKKTKQGVCPITKGMVGICVEECSSDGSCPGNQKCCSNGCGHQCIEPKQPSLGCFYKGKFYKNGQSFKDDCNTCTCSKGSAACTEIACLPQPSKVCIYKGKTYKKGESFTDACNECGCTAGGSVICTQRECLSKREQGCLANGRRYKEGESFKISCNSCVCRNSLPLCTKMACPPPPL